MTRRLVQRPAMLLAFAVSIAVAAPACGGDGTSARADRTVAVQMRDIAFAPATLTVRRGERIRFVFANRGQVPHEAYVGDAAAQEAHEKEMREAGGGGHGGHGGSDAITVQPGRTGELTHTFAEAGETLVGCHEPGHYQAGMRITVAVT